MAQHALQVSDEQMKELAVKTETTNPWYWGVRTLVKVSHKPFCLVLTTLSIPALYCPQRISKPFQCIWWECRMVQGQSSVIWRGHSPACVTE